MFTTDDQVRKSAWFHNPKTRRQKRRKIDYIWLLIATQKLYPTKRKEKLRESKACVQGLENRRKHGQGSTQEVVRETAENPAGENTVHSEKKILLDELSLMKDDLALAHKELQATEEQAERYQAGLTSQTDNGKLAGTIAS